VNAVRPHRTATLKAGKAEAEEPIW